MPHLKFKQLLILSNSAKSANQFQFQRLNLITADDNSVGKSTLVKLLFWGVGCEPDFDTTWNTLDCSTIVSFVISDDEYEIKRYKNIISLKVNGQITEYSKISGDYSIKIADILGFKALLPHQTTGELEVPPPAYYFLPFYMDQKRSWTKAWDNFNKLGQYRAWKGTIIKYHVGLLTPEYFELEVEKAMKKNNKIVLTKDIEKINHTLEIVENYLPPPTIATVIGDEFDNMTAEIEKDLEDLTKKQENILDVFSNLQSSKSHLEHQKKIAENLISELDKDYTFSIENISEDNIECPLCGTEHENSILNKTSILKDKNQAVVQLESIIDELTNTDKKLEKTKTELKSVRNRIDELNRKYLIEESDEQFTFLNIIESIGVHSIKDNVVESKKEKQSTVKDIDRGIELAKKSQKKLYTKEYIDDINLNFNTLLSAYIKVLNAQAVNLSKINSPLDYNKIVSEGGAAENSRAILAYYLAIFSLVEKQGNEVISPLVIDTPNQQEQSENNYSSIVELIQTKISKNNQVIICAMENSKLEPLKKSANIIVLNNSKLLDTKKYSQIKKVFDTWD